MNHYIEDIIETITNHQTFRIAFLGDSITSTEWVHPNWQEIIEYVLKYEIQAGETEEDKWRLASWYIRCFNAGFNGATTRDLLELLDEHVLQHKPTMAIFVDTINDMDMRLLPEEHRDNTKKIVEQLEEKVKHVIVCTSPAGLNENYNQRQQAYTQQMLTLVPFAKSQFVDLYQESHKLNRTPLFTFISDEGNPAMGIEPGGLDFSHPNALGNAYIAQILLQTIFGIDIDPERYIKDARADIKYPSY